ncbi:ThuA domain-containing protein [Flavicella sediminum]|uniref:ThuA domain-containing protein n=1 Tax=Flavicella sediminum TaxID=2585141 RepID=UPI00111CDC36|nr:ThuA domain-containing protein [Flavicella sediminum]
MKNKFLFLSIVFFTTSLTLISQSKTTNTDVKKLKILNFYGDNGFVHSSQEAGLKLIENLGIQNKWEVVTTADAAIFDTSVIVSFDAIIFNNNCGNKGQILSKAQQSLLQKYIRNGGGFVGIHCAGAIWKEGGEFQNWYEGLIGTKLVDHPKVQSARLLVEDSTNQITKHLDKEWEVKDEWHRFSSNPRNHVKVLLSVDEDSYIGTQKMRGDHPFTWCHNYDGGRSFFTSLGHTKEIYTDFNFQKLVEEGIKWAADSSNNTATLPLSEGLLLDLNADENLLIEARDKVSSWSNSVTNKIQKFVKQDTGRKIKGSGRPKLKLKVPKLNGHNSVVFHRQELVNHQEDAFDHLTQGSGYTWFSVMSVSKQVKGKPGVNSFFGNLRNTNVDKKGQYEGFWGGVNLKNHVWMSSRNGLQKGTWSDGSPLLLAEEPLLKEKYYLVMGRMGAGVGDVKMELFVNTTKAVVEKSFPVNAKANPSKMVIGQERDATNHPGAESFDGEIARFLIFERPLFDEELQILSEHLKEKYNIH